MTALFIIGIVLCGAALIVSLMFTAANWEYSDDDTMFGVGNSVALTFAIIVMSIALGMQ